MKYVKPELEISKIALKLLDEIYSPDIVYRATGICLMDLVCTKQVQSILFEELHQNENENLAKAIDTLENKFGKNVVRTGF